MTILTVMTIIDNNYKNDNIESSNSISNSDKNGDNDHEATPTVL